MVTHVTRRKDNNKPRKSVLPLFPGYISITGTKETLFKLYATGRVATIITIKHQKKFIAELGQIYSILEKGVPLEPMDFAFEAGAEVGVTTGPLRGIRGVVASVKNQKKLILSVDGLGQAMMSIDASMVRLIDRKSISGHAALSLQTPSRSPAIRSDWPRSCSLRLPRRCSGAGGKLGSALVICAGIVLYIFQPARSLIFTAVI